MDGWNCAVSAEKLFRPSIGETLVFARLLQSVLQLPRAFATKSLTKPFRLAWRWSVRT